MRIIRFMFLFIVFMVPFNLTAADFPTMETVRLVLNCMAENGGLSDENLYTCSCRHDKISSQMPFSEYEEGVTYERNKAMPGKKGDFFRDNKRGKGFYEILVDIRQSANAQCITVKKVEPQRDS